jgi:hypothetical protein
MMIHFPKMPENSRPEAPETQQFTANCGSGWGSRESDTNVAENPGEISEGLKFPTQKQWLYSENRGSVAAA